MCKSSNSVIYCGIFFDFDEVQKKAKAFGDPLSKIIEKPHVTLAFRPKAQKVEELRAHLGERVCFELYEFGNDGQNAGFRVKLASAGSCSEVVEKMINGIHIPHITTSIAKGAKAVNTWRLFEDDSNTSHPIAPVVVEGVIGSFLENGEVSFG